jgi:hypothetical protein
MTAPEWLFKLISFILVVLAILFIVGLLNAGQQEQQDPRNYNPTPDLSCPNC